MKHRRLLQALWLGTLILAAATIGRAGPPAAWGRIELIRDRWGTPHVFAETDEGAFYGLGRAAAEDRLYQMQFNRRLMQGRLAEAVGRLPKRRQRQFGPKDALEEDRLMRTLGWEWAARRLAAALPEETRRMLEAYCAGINDHIREHEGRWHPLFAEQGWAPEPWTPADCLLAWWQVGRFFAADGLRELWTLRQRNDPRWAARQNARRVVDDEAAVVRREDVSEDWIRRTEEFMRRHGLDRVGQGGPEAEGPKFSHAWVIGGRLTSTGSAILVSDPQTPVSNPSLFHEFHVAGKTFNVRGIGVPGSPMLLIGFTENVAWGLTALGADQADLFVLKTDPHRPDQYELDGRWRPMEVRTEEIRVAGGETGRLRVRETVFGPVVSEFALGRQREEVAVKRVPLCDRSNETHQAMLPMWRARSAADFLRAAGDWRFPTANCVFGDREGRIGYTTLGAIPVRSPHAPEPGLAHDGSRSENDWLGFVPPDLLPHVLDPKRGYLVSANHRTIQSFYRLTLGTSTGSAGDTDRGWRIKQRIREALTKGGPITPEAVLDMQADTVNAVKQAILRLGYHLREHQREALSGAALRTLDHLENWYAAGARSDMSRPGTELANQMGVLFRSMVEPLADTYGGGVSGLVLALKTLTKRLEEQGRAARFSEPEIRFIDRALAGAWQRATAAYGRDPARWHEAARRQAANARMGYFENLAGYGSLAPEWDITRPLLQVIDGSTILAQPGQSYTQFVRLDDPDASLTILPPGPSEQPASPWRFSNLPAWAGGELHPAPLSRKAVEPLAVSFRLLSGRAEAERPPSRGRNMRANPNARENAPHRPAVSRRGTER
ncbi:MAG: penicillin acylase family protein [Verrucomicrobia bacterium]|nr:MAG: penicillin acylase family protein [Verrucomicrobiota bacterium]